MAQDPRSRRCIVSPGRFENLSGKGTSYSCPMQVIRFSYLPVFIKGVQSLQFVEIVLCPMSPPPCNSSQRFVFFFSRQILTL